MKVPYESKTDRQLKVCIVTHEFPVMDVPYGGVGNVYSTLVQLLQSQGHHVRVLLTADVSFRRKAVKLSSHNKVLVDVPEPNPVWIAPDINMRKQYQVLSYFMKHNEFDIVHFHDYQGYGYLTLLAKKQGWAFQNIMFLVNLQSPTLWNSLANKKYANQLVEEVNFYEKKMIEYADCVISPSIYLLNYVKKHGFQLPPNTYTLQNPLLPIHIDETERPVDRLGYQEIVFFGKLEYKKGVKVLLNAVEKLGSDFLDEYPITITFLGRDTMLSGKSSKAELTEFIGKSTILNEISIQFFEEFSREQSINYLKNSTRLAVFPALIDNSPYTILECIMNKVNFIATPVGGISELIHPDDRSKVLFDTNVNALAQRLRKILSEPVPLTARPAVHPDDTAALWSGLHNWLASNIDRNPSLSVDSLLINDPPLVTVCVTHFERVDLLKISLLSLAEQSYKNFEVGIVDDGSSATTVMRIKNELIPFLDEKFQDRYQLFLRPNGYLGAARNFCASQYPSAKYITFLDDDDVIKPNYLERLVKVAEFTGYDAISTFFDVFTAPPLTDPRAVTIEPPDHHIYAFSGGDKITPMLGNVLGGANVFIKRTIFDMVGGYTTYQSVGFEDYEFLLRVKLKGLSHTVIPDPIIWIRNTANSMMKRDDPFNGELRVLSAYMDLPEYKPINTLFLFTKGLLGKAPPSLSASTESAPNANRKVITNSKRDFSKVQGKRGWYYGFRRYAKSFDLNLTRSIYVDDAQDGSRWITTSNSYVWPYIDSASQHPSTIDHTITCAVRRWVSYEEGKFMFTFTTQKSSVLENCGDGVDIFLLVDGKVVYKRTAKTGDRDVKDFEVELKVDSKVDVVVHPKKNDSCDATITELEIWTTNT